jgi:hypothetical protein
VAMGVRLLQTRRSPDDRRLVQFIGG